MTLRRVLHALLALTLLAAPRAARAQACTPQVTGLVLSGGGAKGFAHIGVFKVLDSLGIVPDMIVGSSIGAIMGAMYASGYTGSEIDSIARALPISDVIRAYSPEAPGVIGRLPALAVWERDGSGWALQTGSVREAEVNALMSALMLRGNLLARGDFDRLPIPLRVIATRLSTRSPVVLDKGDLAQAVRASFAIPLIFRPGRVGDLVLMDGGVSDNIPIGTARAMGAERVIVSTLPTAAVDDALLGDPFKVALQLSDFLFLNDTTQYRPGDVIIRNRTSTSNPLDFSAAAIDTLVAGGMEVARAMFAEAGCVVTRRGGGVGGRATARAALPDQVTDVVVPGVRPVEARTLRVALGLASERPVHEDSLRRRLLAIGQSDDYHAIWLTPQRSATVSRTPGAPAADSTVAFRIAPVFGAREAFLTGGAYDNDLGGRLWGGYANRALLGSAVEGAVIADFGKYRQEVRASARRRVPAFARAVPLVAQVGTIGEDVRIFTDSAEVAPIATREFEFAAGVGRTLERGFAVAILPYVRAWRGADAEVGAAGVRVHVAQDRRGSPPHAVFEADVNTRFQRAHVELTRSYTLASVDVTPVARVGWSRRAPLQQQFTLGGFAGFPGLRTTERRGAHEAMLGVDFTRRAYGPLRALVQLRAGAIGTDGAFLAKRAGTPFGELLGGARVGVDARIGVLTVQVARGINTVGGDTWFLRVGPWF